MEWGVESGMSGEEVLEVTLKQKRSRSSHTTRRLSAFHGKEGRQKQAWPPLLKGRAPSGISLVCPASHHNPSFWCPGGVSYSILSFRHFE